MASFVEYRKGPLFAVSAVLTAVGALIKLLLDGVLATYLLREMAS
jgi:hypothetical protein